MNAPTGGAMNPPNAAKATIELERSQRQVMQAEKMAAIGLLAAGVAHELNNPIGFVTSNIGTLSTYVDAFISLIETAR